MNRLTISLAALAARLPDHDAYFGDALRAAPATTLDGALRAIPRDPEQFIPAMIVPLFFFIVKFLGWLMRVRKEEKTTPLPTQTREQELLTEIRDLLAQQKA